MSPPGLTAQPRPGGSTISTRTGSQIELIGAVPENGPPNDAGPRDMTPEGTGTTTSTDQSTDVLIIGDPARRLDQRIRLLVGSISGNLTKLHVLVEEAKQGEIHKALGFPSWTAYLADALTIEVKLDRDQRRELVGYLSGEGMSQRAIAPIVGVDQKTVGNDLRSAREENSSPEPINPAPVIGIDGKTYQPKPPEPKQSRRRPITDAFGTITWQLGKKTESLLRLKDDDRFLRNGEELARANLSDLRRASQRLDEVIGQLESWWDR